MKGEVAVTRSTRSVSCTHPSRSKPRKHRLPAVTDSPSSPYAPGALRATTDCERERVERLCLAHPEFAKLGHDPLLQLAETYLDDEDRALRSELPREAVGYRRPRSDDVAPAWSDEAGFMTPSFGVFAAGTAVLALGFAIPTGTTLGAAASTVAIMAGAALIGASFEWANDEERA